MIDGYFYNDGLIFLRISTFYWDVTRYSNVEVFGHSSYTICIVFTSYNGFFVTF